MTEVPLARHAGRVAAGLEQFGDRGLGRIETVSRVRSERTVDADAVRVAPGEECGPRCGADGLGDVEVGEHRASVGEAVEVWCCVALRAEDADVAVALIIGEDHDDVRQAVGGTGGERSEQTQDEGGFE